MKGLCGALDGIACVRVGPAVQKSVSGPGGVAQWSRVRHSGAACGEDELTQRLSPPLHVRAGAPPLIVLEVEQGRARVADPEAIHPLALGGAGDPLRYRLLSAVLFRPRSDELEPHYSMVWRGGEGRWWLMDDNANGAVAMELSAAARDAWCGTRPDGWSPVLLTYCRVPD